MGLTPVDAKGLAGRQTPYGTHACLAGGRHTALMHAWQVDAIAQPHMAAALTSTFSCWHVFTDFLHIALPIQLLASIMFPASADAGAPQDSCCARCASVVFILAGILVALMLLPVGLLAGMHAPYPPHVCCCRWASSQACMPHTPPHVCCCRWASS